MLTHLKPNYTKNALLVDGYLRANFKKNLIKDISQTCQLFYDHLFYFQFDHIAIQDLRLGRGDEDSMVWANNGKSEWNHRGLTFKCHTYSNCLYLQTCCPKNCKSFRFVFEMYCDDLNQGSVGCANIDTVGDADYYDVWLMDIPQRLPEHITSLSLKVYIDLMFMKYIDDKPNDIYKEMKLSQNIKFVWKIDDDLANKFRNAEVGEIFYSDMFGNNNEKNKRNQYGFVLKFEPKQSIGSHRLSLYFVMAPKHIGDLFADVTLNNGIECEQRKDVLYSINGQTFVWIWTQKYGLKELLKVSNEFSVELKIQSVRDLEGQIVDKSMWSEYGIVL